MPPLDACTNSRCGCCFLPWDVSIERSDTAARDQSERSGVVRSGLTPSNVGCRTVEGGKVGRQSEGVLHGPVQSGSGLSSVVVWNAQPCGPCASRGPAGGSPACAYACSSRAPSAWSKLSWFFSAVSSVGSRVDACDRKWLVTAIMQLLTGGQGSQYLNLCTGMRPCRHEALRQQLGLPSRRND